MFDTFTTLQSAGQFHTYMSLYANTLNMNWSWAIRYAWLIMPTVNYVQCISCMTRHRRQRTPVRRRYPQFSCSQAGVVLLWGSPQCCPGPGSSTMGGPKCCLAPSSSMMECPQILPSPPIFLRLHLVMEGCWRSQTQLQGRVCVYN